MNHRIILLHLSLVSLIGCTATDPYKPRPETTPGLDDHGNVLGCSWYCTGIDIGVSATSTLSDGIYSYEPSNVHDGKKDTVWAEGAEGYGIGERLVFSFDMRDRPSVHPGHEFGIDSVSILNGFARSDELWRANARVKSMKVHFNGKYLSTIRLEDSPGPQKIGLPRMVFRPGRLHRVAFEIAEVYPGSQHEDTVLADFFFDGFGVH